MNCVMCLADGETTAASCSVDVGDGCGKEPYCGGCAESMERQGWKIAPLPNDADDDFPPAGTPCAPCKAKGHFCQAEEYAVGDSEEGVCSSCSKGEECESVRARRSSSPSEESLAITRLPAREWRDIHKGQKESAAEMLRGGASLRSAADASGLAKNTVAAIREGIKDELPEKCECGRAAGHKGWCKTRVEKSPARQETLRDMHSLSPVTRGERGTYVLSKDTREAIAQDPEPNGNKVAEKYGCSRATVDNIRKSAGTFVPAQRRGPKPKEKAELTITTPVTIVTVSRDEPTPDMTLSRAFEMVRAELSAANESLLDAGEGEDFTESIKANKDAIDLLHDYHPAFMGFNAGGQKVSVYERAKEQAQSELRLIDLEIQRLTKRRDALLPILESLTKGHEAERDTR